jgi:pimeloyl-ACP methyl ester carboxylesterase
MDTVRSKDGTTIAYDRSGDGRALVLVNGAPCRRRFGPMGSLAQALATDFTVYTYDRRGRDESGDATEYTVQPELDDLAAVVDATGGSALVYGSSPGGVLGLRAAADGVRITKLAMYEPPFILDGKRLPIPEGYVSYLKGLVAVGRRGDAVEYFLTVGAGLPAELVAPMRAAPFLRPWRRRRTPSCTAQRP